MYKIYIVEPGETIETIAANLNISPNVLYDINGFRPNQMLQVGDQIIVPAVNTKYMSYIVKRGDTPYALSQRFNISVDELLTINGLEKDDYIYPEQELLIPNMTNKYYMTKKDDTINDIVKKSGLSINDLLEKNKTIYVLPDQIIFYN